MARVYGKYGREIQNWRVNINMDFEELGLEGMSWIHLKTIFKKNHPHCVCITKLY
jgi:hypothetical protein